jgi:phthalate 4,5-dioxygenase oxygenase subunit
VLDELCPHRRVSLALARNEDNGLRCIYHGWKLNAAGDLIDVPNVEGNADKFCKSVRLNKYKVREAGGIVWVYLGDESVEPLFPDLPFTNVPEENRAVTSQQVRSNWLQAVEATMDTTHVSFLHQSTTELTSGGNQRLNMSKKRTARFEFENRPYGFRYAAIRQISEDKVYVRVNNFVMPWYGIVCPPEKDGPSTVFFSVPVDDFTHRAWFVHFNPVKPLGITPISITPDVFHWPPLPPGSADENWGQNRDLMQRGHFSGFPQHLATEDFAMFVSQGPIFDRSKEQLCAADAAIVRVRQMILDSVKEFMQGRPPYLARNDALDYKQVVSFGAELASGVKWQEAS